MSTEVAYAEVATPPPIPRGDRLRAALWMTAAQAGFVAMTVLARFGAPGARWQELAMFRFLGGLFVAAATVGHALLAVLFSSLTSTGGGHALSLSGMPLQVVLTTLAGAALWPLLARIEPGERPAPGVLG